MATDFITQPESLFPEIEWQLPVNKARTGNMAILGGHAEGFQTVIVTYQYVKKVSRGGVRLILPKRLERLLPKNEDIVYLPSTPSGSIADSDEILGVLEGIDHILFAGDLSRNSQTQLLIERINELGLMKTYAGDSDYYLHSVPPYRATLVFEFGDLQKILLKQRGPHQLVASSGKVGISKALSGFTSDNEVNIVLVREASVFAASQGQVSLTECSQPDLKKLAGMSAYTVMSMPSKQFEALTYAVWACTHGEEEAS